MTIDSVLDKVLGRHSVHYNYSKRETRERLTQAITNLIAQEANKAVASELKLLIDAEVIKPEYHGTVVMKYNELTAEKESNNGNN